MRYSLLLVDFLTKFVRDPSFLDIESRSFALKDASAGERVIRSHLPPRTRTRTLNLSDPYHLSFTQGCFVNQDKTNRMKVY